jgi:antitoxin component YwqK of YwqJK toxin-antitoxin module
MKKKLLFGISAAVFVVFSCDSNEKINSNQVVDYYTNGKIKSIKQYANGELDGTCVWFYWNGNLKEKISFKNGLGNGNAHYFYESGALKSHRYFRNGKRVGYVADYFDDSVGVIKAVLLFDNYGKLAYRKTFDSLRNVLKEEGKKPE